MQCDFKSKLTDKYKGLGTVQETLAPMQQPDNDTCTQEGDLIVTVEREGCGEQSD